VVLYLFAERSQIQTDDLVRESH